MVLPDINKEEICEAALEELSAILSSRVFVYECLLNPNKRWFQFWKPKYIFKEYIENANDE